MTFLITYERLFMERENTPIYFWCMASANKMLNSMSFALKRVKKNPPAASDMHSGLIFSKRVCRQTA